MVQLTIQNFPVDASDIASAINFDGVEASGEPTITATLISANLTDGRSFSAFGAFQPLVTALETQNLDVLLAQIDQIRIDGLSVSVGGTPWLDMAGIDLTGLEILTFLDSSGVGDPDDVGDDDIDAGAAFLFTGNDTIVSGIGNDTLRGYGG
ncbi:MAG: hypothetical protein IT561_05930, partial [Alphaproteobacteria bacterium]|nr:hypothetical protein [Alphaproteobacteria bacterium]